MTRDADPSAPPLSPLRDGLARAQYAAARAAAGIVRAMPLDMASATMGAAWRTIAPWTHRHPRALGHVALAMPELDEAERRRIVMGMWDNLGRVTAETLQIDRLIADPSRIELPPRTIEILEQARQGGVLVSLHTGNWEVVVRAATAAGLIATGIYRAVDNPYVERWLYDMRRPLYPGGLIPKGDPAARLLIARAKRRETIAVMADLRDSRGILVPFFGHMAYANPFPAMVALMTRKPLIAGRVMRLDGARFRIDAEEIAVTRTGERIGDVLATTIALHERFETWIRERPEQWMWIHRKWEVAQAKRRAARFIGPPNREED